MGKHRQIEITSTLLYLMSAMVFDPDTPHNELPPLPPPVDIETKIVLKAAQSANVALAKLREVGRLIPNQEILITSLPLVEAAASSKIENIFTTADTLYRAIACPDQTTDPQTKEVLNYRDALYAGVEYLANGGKLDKRLLEQTCSIVRGNETRRRERGVYIGNSYVRAYTPPDDPIVIDSLIDQLSAYASTDNDVDPLVRMALIHYQLEAIHPFEDGNGRTGRIINILFLIYMKLLDIPVLYLSRYIIQHKSEYYTCLTGVTRDNDWERWVLYMLNAVKWTSEETYDKILSIHRLMTETLEYCREHLPKSIYSYELIEQIYLLPYCKPSHLTAAGLGQRQTSMRYLKELEKIGVLQSKRMGREKIYMNLKLCDLLGIDNI